MHNLTKKLHQRKYLYTLFLIISILIVLFVNLRPGFVFATGDYRYHINRIEALATAIQHFNFLPKVDEFFSGGLGYASSLFYPDLFLYPAAILRVLGVPIIVTYLLTQVGINFLTLTVTFLAGKRLHFSTKNNLIFTFVYVLSSYRLQVLYSRHDIGELMGMIFFPLVLSELINLKKGNTKEWYVLTFAMVGIGLSHIISLFMMVCFAAMYVILNIKYFWDKDRIMAIVKAALVSIGLVFGFYAPILEQMADQQFTLKTDPLIFIYQQTQSFTDLVSHSFSNQVFHASTVNVGFVIFVGLVVYSIYNLIRRKNISLTLIALFMFISCSDWFPWYQLRDTLFSAFQFPWRFFSVISLIVAYFIANDDLHIFDIKYTTPVLLIGMLILSFALGQFTVQASPWRINSYQSYNQISSYLIGAGHEYLPSEVNYDEVKENKARTLEYDSKQIKISDQKITKNIIKFKFNAKNKSKVVLPLFYYKGYQANVSGSGHSTVPALNKQNGYAQIKLSGSGNVVVQYHYTTIQKIGLAVSLATASYCGYLIWQRRQSID